MAPSNLPGTTRFDGGDVGKGRGCPSNVMSRPNGGWPGRPVTVRSYSRRCSSISPTSLAAPFNSIEVGELLTAVGVGTGLVSFGAGSFYGAPVFYNLVALFGIVSSVTEAGQLGTCQRPLVPHWRRPRLRSLPSSGSNARWSSNQIPVSRSSERGPVRNSERTNIGEIAVRDNIHNWAVSS